MKTSNIPRFSRRERGFALIVTLSLMILLTVIAVGLLQLSSVSLRASSQGDARALARSNAMMALQMAIGQLQRTAGPDQRITGPAKLASADYPASWAGVWTPGILDATGLMPPVAPTTDGSRNYLVDARVKPLNSNWKFEWFIEPLVSPNANGSNPSLAIKYPIDLGIWSTTGSTAGPVEAPEVKVGKAGGLAWWTQDLSQQASLASGANATDAAGVGLSAAPRVDTSKVAGGKLPIDSFTASTDRRKVTSVQGAYLAGKIKGEDNPKNLEDSGTARSYGLFTDPVKGGFKADMTRFVESSAAAMGQLPAMGLTGITAKSSILPGAHHLNTGPQWERLRKWYNIPVTATGNLTGTTPTITRAVAPTPVPGYEATASAREGYAVDAVRSNDMPLHPMVVDAGFHWDFTPFPANAASVRVHIFPRVTLWNPYNATLACGRYVVAMPKQIDTGGGLTVELQSSSGPPEKLQVIGSHGAQFRPSVVPDSKFLDSTDSYFMFTVENTTFGPGECLVFTPKIPGSFRQPYDPGDPAQNVLTASQAVGLKNFYIEKPTPSLQAAIAPGTGKIVKRYLTGTPTSENVHWRPMPFFLKAAPASGALSATDALTSSAYPTLQRLYLTHAGGGGNPGYVVSETNYNDAPLNLGSDWGVSKDNRKPPRRWNYRHHLSWIDDYIEKEGRLGQPPYNSALMADWNPLASVACRTPSTFMSQAFDLHTGCWYLCKTPVGYEANGPNNTWGFSGGDNIARGCPYGNPFLHKSELSFPLIDIPDPSLPLQSIGSLRNVPLSPWTWHPVKPIGSSRTSLHSDKKFTAIKAIAEQANPWTSIITAPGNGITNFNDIIQSTDSTGEILLYDLAFEANRELWDGTFASSWYRAAAWNGTDPLSNRQYVAHPQLRDSASVRKRADSVSDKDTYGLWLPAYLLANEGAFNVNSISPTAWAAVLGGLKKLVRSDALGTSVAGDHPFAKFRKPASSDLKWGGGLALSDANMATLSDKIVDIVKERGPFLGVADFVNRRLADNPSGDRGALEEALIRAGLANPILKVSEAESNDTGTNVPSEQKGRYTNVSKFLMEGAAGYIEQADLLEPMGGSLCARGDTFRIRATGASYDKSGKLLSRVTCEAIVVRSPDYLIAAAIDQAGSPSTGNSALIPPMKDSGTQWIPNPALNPINQKFGRRFEVLNIKWLTSVNEI